MRSLDKPPQMETYDGTIDTNEEMKNIEIVL
jgi:hypothetical protein